jgi:hypothetical protein
MANVVVTSTTNAIKVVFNDAASAVGMEKGTWRKDKIDLVELVENDTYIRVKVQESNGEFDVSYNETSGALIIDSVDGNDPTSNSDLYDKISALVE